MNIEKSKGHILFIMKDDQPIMEFFSYADKIYRAQLSDAFMDGHRQGRWECDDTQYRRDQLSEIWGLDFGRIS